MKLGQQQTRRVHVAAGDVRMDVDRARHNDLAGCVIRLISTSAARGLDDPAIADPDVGDTVRAVGRIDGVATFDPGQHGQAPGDGSTAAIWASAAATETALLGSFATAGTNVPVAASCSTASWSVPGWPTLM